MGESVSVIIPAYNEEERIRKTLSSLKDIEDINEIIVVDDGSTDSTFKILQSVEGIKLLHIDFNKGKGNAVKYALEHVTNSYVALLDADLCESASEVRKLIEYISPEEKLMIIGKLPAPIRKGGFGIVKRVSGKSFRVLTSKQPEALLSGQRILPLEFLKSIDLPAGFGLEFKLTLEGVKRGIRMIEVPVLMKHRETGRDIKGFLHRARQLKDIMRLIRSETKNK